MASLVNQSLLDGIQPDGTEILMRAIEWASDSVHESAHGQRQLLTRRMKYLRGRTASPRFLQAADFGMGRGLRVLVSSKSTVAPLNPGVVSIR
jgi:hypothetical protein